VNEHQLQTAKRRTFAIISHPDAGKTTITEKLLLFSGAIQLAGSVKGRKAARQIGWKWSNNVESQLLARLCNSIIKTALLIY